MKVIVYKYRKLIWIWVVAHAVILTINLLDIRMNRLLTDYNKYPTHIVWPFVSYSEDIVSHNPYAPDAGYTKFHGIFYGYDWTEFVLYIGLLVVFLTYKVVMVKEHRV